MTVRESAGREQHLCFFPLLALFFQGRPIERRPDKATKNERCETHFFPRILSPVATSPAHALLASLQAESVSQLLPLDAQQSPCTRTERSKLLSPEKGTNDLEPFFVVSAELSIGNRRQP